MYTNTDTIKLFDSNHNFVDNFDEIVEEVLISVHGDHYYDIDEDIINSNTNEKEISEKDKQLSKTIDLVEHNVVKDAPKITIVDERKNKVSIKDFIPVLFFIIIFAIILFAGYYFLNNLDFTEVIGKWTQVK